MQAYNSPIEEIKSFFKQRSLLSRLILINVAVFILTNLINLLFWLAQTGGETSLMVAWFAVPSNISDLILKPWTLLTYMFLQESFFHLFFNMIILYFSGRIFSEYLNSVKLLSVYIWGGLFGGLLFVITYNIFPVFQGAVYYSVPLLGSSAAVIAILVAIATHVPNYNIHLIIIGRVKLKHLAIFFIIIDVLSIQRGNAGGHISHLGGALWGFTYIWLLKNGYSMNWSRFKLPKFSVRNKPRKAYTNPGKPKRPVSDDEYNRNKNKQQKEIDTILEKISKSGYSSLTKKEKELLFKNSNK